jgi:hypothetical protein
LAYYDKWNKNGSILIVNAMNVSSLAIDRYKGEIKNRHFKYDDMMPRDNQGVCIA